MQDDNSEHDGTITITAQELLTARDCEPIICSDGCLVGYAWEPADKPSATMLKHVKEFAANVRLASLVYGNLSPEEKQWMCDGLLQITREIAREGYLTKYGVYTTEDQKHGCVVSFWPIQAEHNGKFRVPRRFEDLIPKKLQPGTRSRPEAAAQC